MMMGDYEHGYEQGYTDGTEDGRPTTADRLEGEAVDAEDIADALATICQLTGADAFRAVHGQHQTDAEWAIFVMMNAIDRRTGEVSDSTAQEGLDRFMSPYTR